MVRQCPFLGIRLYHSNASYCKPYNPPPQDELHGNIEKDQGIWGNIKRMRSVGGGWMWLSWKWERDMIGSLVDDSPCAPLPSKEVKQLHGDQTPSNVGSSL